MKTKLTIGGKTFDENQIPLMKTGNTERQVNSADVSGYRVLSRAGTSSEGVRRTIKSPNLSVSGNGSDIRNNIINGTERSIDVQTNSNNVTSNNNVTQMNGRKIYRLSSEQEQANKSSAVLYSVITEHRTASNFSAEYRSSNISVGQRMRTADPTVTEKGLGRGPQTAVQPKSLIRSVPVPSVRNESLVEGIYVNNVTGTRFIPNATRRLPTGGISSRALNYVGSKDDMGSQTVRGTVTSGRMAYTTLRGTARAVRTISRPNRSTHFKTSNGRFSIKRGSIRITKSTAKAVIRKTASVAESAVDSTDNMMLSGAKESYYASKYAVKTAKVTARATGYTVKTAYRAGNKIGDKAITTVKRAGNTVYKYGTKATKGVVNSVKAVYTSVKGIVATLSGSSMIASVASFVLIACIFLSVFAVLFGGVGIVETTLNAIADGIFGHEYNQTDISTYLNDANKGVPYRRNIKIDSIYSYTRLFLKDGDYHVLYFKIAEDERKPSNITDEDDAKFTISLRFYTVEEIVEIMSPLFYAKLLVDYDLRPDDEEAAEALEDIFVEIFDNELEFGHTTCDMPVHTCGSQHSLATCPNPVFTVHKTFTCDACCKYVCDGHYKDCMHDCRESPDCNYGMFSGCAHVCDTATCGEISYCPEGSECGFQCKGLSTCGGHKTVTFIWNMSDIHEMYEEYFDKPIAELKEKTDRTDAEQERLDILTIYYEMLRAYTDGNNE